MSDLMQKALQEREFDMCADKAGHHNRQKIFYLIMALIFTDTVLYGSIVPLIPVYMKTFHLTTFTFGIIFSSYAFGVLVLSIPLGMMAEKYGYRKIFLSGMTALALSCLFYGLANHAWMLLVCRFFQGAAAAASWTAGLAAVAVLYPLQQGQKIGLLMAVMSLGTIFGPPIGGFLYHFFGYHQMFAVLSLFCGALIFLIFKVDFADLDGDGRGSSHINFSFVLKNQKLLYFSLVLIILASTWGLLEILLSVHLDQQFSLGAVQIGLFFGFTGIVNAVSDALAGHLSDHYGYDRFVFWGLLATALFFPFLALTASIVILLLLMTLIGIASGAAVTPSQPLMYRLVVSDPETSPQGAGVIYGLYNACYSVGMFLGPILGGFLNTHFKLFWSLTIFSFLFLASAALFYVMIIDRQKKTQNFVHPE
ncbi:MFS transporter [Candidatus Formimonas warabiya]|uniref:Major facilitator superfamily (MFS) profile domain-containing protein n=1 Tax=Formimonas warabiya TaxID=1761012 RepID=A0A3G1KVT1_FORW1|nr:MFS transporter [Candidatus Formimonas warabiya]ATW26520.1 hypothetical protein DCMF_18760 [Candidatus Formimonas warabiya]